MIINRGFLKSLCLACFTTAGFVYVYKYNINIFTYTKTIIYSFDSCILASIILNVSRRHQTNNTDETRSQTRSFFALCSIRLSRRAVQIHTLKQTQNHLLIQPQTKEKTSSQNYKLPFYLFFLVSQY